MTIICSVEEVLYIGVGVWQLHTTIYGGHVTGDRCDPNKCVIYVQQPNKIASRAINTRKTSSIAYGLATGDEL